MRVLRGEFAKWHLRQAQKSLAKLNEWKARRAMDSEDAVFQEFVSGDLQSIDAIERLQKLGHQPKDAERLVDEWIEGQE